jgi:hypothetical protein
MIVVRAGDNPRSAIISTRSRKLSLNRRYQRNAEDDDFPIEMAAFEKIIYALHGGQPSSCRSLTGKYAPLPPFAP